MKSTLCLCLDNLRSAYNVGSIFRTADGLGIKELYLCGITPTPLNEKLQKTALGSLYSVPWSHHCDTLSCIDYCQSLGLTIVSLEVTPRSLPLYQYNFDKPSVLVVGNELSGVNSKILTLSAATLSIPQEGIKESFNVASAAAIAIYEWYRQTL